MNFRYGIRRHQFQIFQNAPPILSETFGARICTYKKFWNCFQILNRCCNDFCHGKTRKYSRNIFPIFISPRRQHLSHPLCNVTSFSCPFKNKTRKEMKSYLPRLIAFVQQLWRRIPNIARGKISFSTTAVSST